MEHNSVLRPIYLAHETIGCEYTVVKGDKTGMIDYADLEKAIQPNTKMIAITHSSNVTGNIVDLEKVVAICEKHNLISVVDASQTAGVVPIDVDKLGVDVLCFTGHKKFIRASRNRWALRKIKKILKLEDIKLEVVE